MTKAIITNQFLVSGSTHGSEQMELKRRCSAAGFALHRTGRFGVGVLSYFMVADEIRIRTERSSETGTAEGWAWEFVSDGLESFGELRRLAASGHGTSVSLRLRSDAVGPDIATWTTTVADYLRNLLVTTPCTVRLSTLEGDEIVFRSGWCRSDATLAARLAHEPFATVRDDSPTAEPTYLSSVARRRRADRESRQSELEQELRAAIRFDQFTGDLRAELGRFRASIPYLDLPGGQAMAYLAVTAADDTLTIGRLDQADIWSPPGEFVVAWNGMRLLAEGEPYYFDLPAVVEIDFTGDAAGELAVDRNVLQLNEEGDAALREVREAVEARRRELVVEWDGAAYRTLNRAVTGLPYGVSGSRWLVSEAGERVWAPSRPRPRAVPTLRSKWELERPESARSRSRWYPY